MGVTKNAIVGKAHRLDLPARPSPIRKQDAVGGAPAIGQPGGVGAHGILRTQGQPTRVGDPTVRRAAGIVAARSGKGVKHTDLVAVELDDLARTRRLSPGGSGDLLSAALFLDFFATRQTESGVPPCRH